VPRYQKPIEKATFSPVIPVAIALIFMALSALAPTAVMGAAYFQTGASTATQQLLLLPVESTTVELQTHTADMTVTLAGVDGGQDGLTLVIDAMYRLVNPGAEPVNLLLRLSPYPATSVTTPANVTLTSDGRPVSLQPAENGGSSGQITIAADSRAEVRLSYTLALDARLPLIRYDARGLKEWPGQTSTRIAIALPVAIPSESWLRLEPSDWRYQTDQENGVKWLYDERLPNQPIILQFVHPTLWREIQAAQQAIIAAPSPTNSVRLGEIYHDLYDRSASSQSTSERFFAQALAAYATGIENGAARGATPQDLAPLHMGAAALYRTRVVDSGGGISPTYAELMVQSARTAAQGFPADDARYDEMMRWQGEGLNILLDAANDRRDWPTALMLVEQLTALPAGIVNPARLEQAQRSLQVQQALQLLEEDDRESAIALAGPEIVDATLAPPADDQSLFASWQVTMTGDLNGTELIFLARPVPERTAEASQALADQVAEWKETRATRKVNVKLDEVQLGGGAQGLRLSVSLSSNIEGETLAALVSPNPQWAFLRSVLSQVGIESEKEGRLVWREITVRQPLDLRSVGDQWDAMAANLSREAAQLEQVGADTDPESALRARIQAVNYRNAARTWEELARNSWVVTTLSVPAGVRNVSRTWLTTATSPPGIFEFSAQTISGMRLLIAATIMIIGLLLLTTLLWWLL